MELKKSDWEDARNQAELILRQTEISRIVNENLLNIANEKLKEFPEEIPVNNPNPLIV